MNEIKTFCSEKSMTQAMEDAFIMYCKSSYAVEYLLKRDGDTIANVLKAMTRPQVEDAWDKFIREMKHLLPSES